MYGCDTSEIAAMPKGCAEHLKHIEHVHTDDVGMISVLIDFIKDKCLGNGSVLLKIFGGNIQEFEPTLTIPHKKKRSA